MTSTRRDALNYFVVSAVAMMAMVPSRVWAVVINANAIADFNSGNWRAAADQASRSRDPDNLAFAARSLLASALLSPSSRNRNSDISQARQFAEAALITEPLHIEGRLQLATALGLQARTGSPTRAFAAGLPQRVRRLLDSVVRDAPSQAWAHALLGGWHLEGLRIGGAAAQAMLGVNLEVGKVSFARAMRLDSSVAATPFYYAASLLALSPTSHVTDVRALLVRAQNAPVRDAFQAEVKARAAALIVALDTKGPAVAATMALGWL